jgi:hypothetical protein
MVMEEMIQDPNQLTLGIEAQVLTAVEEVRLAEFKASNVRSNERLLSTLLAKRAFLLENGFEEGKDFTFSLTEKEADFKVNVAYWGEESKEVVYTATSVQGGCTLTYSRYNKFKDEVETRAAGFDIEKGKIECYSIVGSARKVTPKTLKEKLWDLNTEATHELQFARNKKGVVEYTVEKYQALAPEAEVTADRDHTWSNNRYREFDVVKVVYSNGSLLIVKPGVHNDQETIHKFVDAATKNLTAVELAQYLNGHV